MTNLEKLEELTKQLKFQDTDSSRLIEVLQETPGIAPSTIFGLIHQTNVAVVNMHTAKGADFVRHSHAEYEVCILYIGQLVVKTELQQTSYNAPAAIEFFPHEEHQIICTQDADMIVVSVPAIDAWPNGEIKHAGS